MADVAIKPEIKIDPADDEARLADVEEFEEDTDLQFPAADTRAWFASIPPDLWAAWHKIYENAPEDEQIEIGKMRVYNTNEGEPADNKHQKIEIHLNKGLEDTSILPQKYELKIQTTGYNNSIVFSEKDLPGHTTRAFGRNRYLSGGNHNSANSNRSSGINKTDRYAKKSGYASAIPKQTALAPPIQHEALVTALINPEEFFENVADAERASAQGRQSILTGDSHRIMANRNDAFSTFTSIPKALQKKKKPKEKAVRMDQQQLYDAIYQCYKEYKYWRLGVLRQRLQQPEAFIKSTLEVVGNLIRSGDFAGQWMLKPEYAQMMNIDQSQVKNESAVAEEGVDDATDGGTGDEFDEDDMEDVKMEGT